jgi:hypothetical protein
MLKKNMQLLMRNISQIIFIFIILCFPAALPAQTSFSILYVANINGTLENCGCGKQPSGGVDRLKTVIEQCREKYPDLLVLNGGDYLNSYSFLALNGTMLAALRLLKFDLFVPGDQEYVEGAGFNSRLRSILGKAWFVSNAGKSGSAVRTFKFSKLRLNLSAYLSPNCFSFIAQPAYLVLNEFQPVFPEENAPASAFNCLIVHGSLPEAIALAVRYPRYDLILLGHEQYPVSELTGRTRIIGVGKDGEAVILVQVTKSGSGWEIGQTRIELNSSIPAHQEMSSLIKQFKPKFNMETN